MKKYLILLITILFFASCKERASEHPIGNTYYYQEPQPINDSELNSIPNKFIGLYVNDDSTYLNISRKIITNESFFKFRIQK